MVDYFKRPWENRDGYAAHSPLTYADKVTTPLLIQHGEGDPRVPIAGAEVLSRAEGAGQDRGVRHLSARRPRLLEPVQQREQMRRNLEWFGRWLRVGARVH